MTLSLYGNDGEEQLSENITKQTTSMFTNISWTSYLSTIALSSLAWYIFIGARYYMDEIQSVVSGKLKFFKKDIPERPVPHDEHQAIADIHSDQGDNNNKGTDDGPSELFQEAEALTEKIKFAVEDAVYKEYDKEEFIFLMELTVKEHPTVKGTNFQVSITDLIIKECEKLEYYKLSRADIEKIWVAAL